MHALAGRVGLQRSGGSELGTLEGGESAFVPARVGAYRVVAEGAPALVVRVDSAAVCRLNGSTEAAIERRAARRGRRCASISTRWRAITDMLRERAKPGECAAVVKADAYGLGVERVARRLLREGCRRFFVATLAEARELRALAPDAEIGVFEGALASTADALVEIEARPALSSLEQVERWAEGAARCCISTPAWIGSACVRADVVALAKRKDLLDALTLDFVMTHLACADEPEHPLNAEQLARFELRGLLPRARTSIGNSAGTLLDAAHRGDLARPGIALYGGNPFSDRPNPMEAVATLTAPILQLHDVAEPEPVGYGATYIANPPARIAVVGIGYADGYPRNLGNNGTAAVQGRRVPVVGRVMT